MALLLAGTHLSSCALFDSALDQGPRQCLMPIGIEALSRAEQRATMHIPSEPREQLPEPLLPVTPEVRRHLAEFRKGDGRTIFQALCERDKHYPQLVQIFRDEGVPLSLLNLALIESGFNTSARSPSGAVGMWQFMKSTARNYGLEIGLFQDDRRDPVLSTIAAARHLKDLYRIYQDWHLVLAAYNAGPGAIDRAMTRSGFNDFWSLARSGTLKQQTRDFVPRFIAATLLVKDFEANRSAVGQDRSEQRTSYQTPREPGYYSGVESRAGLRRSSAC